MKITLINPNSTQAMNVAILNSALCVARKEDSVHCVCVPEAPALINSDLEELEAAFWTMKKSVTMKDTDGFVIACHSDPGVSAIRQATGKPTFGIGYASMAAAAKHPGKSAILVISEASIFRKIEMQKRYGFEGRFDSYATGYTENMSKKQVFECLFSTAQAALSKMPYKSIVLGCAGMSLVVKELREALKLPVIDGTEEAMKLLFDADSL